MLICYKCTGGERNTSPGNRSKERSKKIADSKLR